MDITPKKWLDISSVEEEILDAVKNALRMPMVRTVTITLPQISIDVEKNYLAAKIAASLKKVDEQDDLA